MALVPFPSASPERADEDTHLQPADADRFDEDDDGAGARMSFLEHLDELRKRLIYSVYALLAGCSVAFFFAGRIQEFIFVPLHQALGGESFIYTRGFEPFMLTMKTGALAGL